MITVPRQGLVDGVVHHFVDHVMEAGAIIGIANVHSRSLANRFQPPKDLDRFGAIGIAFKMLFVQLCGIRVRADHVFSVFHYS